MSQSEMHYFFKYLPSLLPGINQTNKIYSNDDQEWSTKIVNFMTDVARVLVLWRGTFNMRLIVKYSENAY